MLLLLLALLLLYAFFLPVTIQADVHHHAATQTRITAHYAFFKKTWQISRFPIAAGQFSKNRFRLLIGLLRRADKARRFLLRRIHLVRLDALILLRTEDAARSTLLSGAAQSILPCIPAVRRRNVRICVLPEFFRAHSSLNARCIIQVRLGTIILTSMMLLMAYFREQQQTESEAV